MLFNSINYLVFFPVALVFYWIIGYNKLRLQNLFLLTASYVFYGWWDVRFLTLIFISSLIDYLVGNSIFKQHSEIKRKLLLLISVAANLGILGFFKYYNFFIESFGDILQTFGFQINLYSLNIILPVGISFYTFQTLSYTIDIYRRKIEPTGDIIAFFAFVSFFPQLVAGPIERAKHLLPQFLTKRTFSFNKSRDGLRQMLWGFFKKVVIADNAAEIVNNTFAHYSTMSSTVLLVSVLLFAIQIYCDFSGYSDIAIGTARIFGFELMDNFNYPYFAESIPEFWHRWHISLSTWFRDYVYIPLGGSRTTELRHKVNIIITFVISGFWHGANWTFMFWGFLHGLYYLFADAVNISHFQLSKYANRRVLSFSKRFSTIIFILFAWIFFRSASIYDAFGYISHIFNNRFLADVPVQATLVLFLSALLFTTEWFQRNKSHALEIGSLNTVSRWSIYISLLFIIFIFGNFGEVEFIYFQF